MRTRIAAVALTTLALGLAAAPADASAVAKGRYSDGPNLVKTNGKKVQRLFFQSGLSQCSPVPFKTGPVKAKVTKGRFTWSGTLEDMLGTPRDLTITGRFSGSKLKVVAVDASCHIPKRTFKLTRKG
jgi:hypothetical protein